MGVTQWVLIGVLAIMLIGYPILASRKTKAENQKVEERTNSLKRGDEIITTAGVYGKIIDIKQDGTAKKIVIETGDGDHKSYMTIDAYAIYSVLNDEKVPVDVKAKEDKKEKSDKKAPIKEEEEVKSEEKVEEPKLEEKVEEVKPEEKPAKKKKSK